MTNEWTRVDLAGLSNEWSDEQYQRRNGDRDEILQIERDGWVIVRTAVDPDAHLGIQERATPEAPIVRLCAKPVADDGWWNCEITILRGQDAIAAIENVNERSGDEGN